MAAAAAAAAAATRQRLQTLSRQSFSNHGGGGGGGGGGAPLLHSHSHLHSPARHQPCLCSLFQQIESNPMCCFTPRPTNRSNPSAEKLNEISSILSVWPEQVQADLRQLHGDIFRVFTKEMEGVVRAIRSLNSSSAAIQMLADQNCFCNERPQRNQVLVANESPLASQTTISNGRPLMNQTPVANGRPQMDQAPVSSGRPQMDQTPVSSGRPQVDQIPVTKLKAADPKSNVEQGKVKAARQKLVSSSNRLADNQEELANQKVTPQVPTKKAPFSITMESDDDSEGRASCVVLNAEPADLMKEATSEEDLQIVLRARKSKRKEIARGRGQGREAEPVAEVVEAAAAKRPRRPNPKYHAARWAT